MRPHAWPLGRGILIGVWGLALVAGLTFSATRPVEPTMPVYLELAETLRSHQLASSFEPIGYPWLLSLVPFVSSPVAVRLLHGLCFILLTSGALLLGIRSLDGPLMTPGRRGLVLAACVALLLGPYQLVNLVRVNDNGVNVLLAFVTCVLIYRSAGRPGGALIATVVTPAVLGLMAFVRPNCFSLLPLVALVAYRSRAGRGGRAAATATAIGTCAAVYMLCAFAATGRPAFWPSNGPYNLFAGNNPATLAALGRDYNAEPSLAEGLSWCGVSSPPRETSATVFVSCTREYVSTQPTEAFTVTLYKIYNVLFRPNFRLADSAIDTGAQIAALFLSVAWWIAVISVLLTTRRLMDWRAGAIVLLYVLPFAVTNADPRFRLPLEPVYAVSLMGTFGARPRS